MNPGLLIAHKNLEVWEELKEFFRSLKSRIILQKYIYRVIHKSLRDFRPLRYSSRGGHAEGEHVNRGRDTPKFLSYLTGARYVDF